jgi:hypothetical protein
MWPPRQFGKNRANSAAANHSYHELNVNFFPSNGIDVAQRQATAADFLENRAVLLPEGWQPTLLTYSHMGI